MTVPLSEPPRWPPPWWRRVHPMVLGALVCVVVVAPSMFVVAVVADVVWGLLAGVGAVALGLFLFVHALMPDRNVHGTKLWQNDGLPGGGAGGGL